MNLLERVWELLGAIFGGLLGGFERRITSVFGSSNARYVKKLQAKVDAINSLEPKYEAMSEEDLRNQTELFRQRLAEGESLDDILVEAFAVCREAGRRFLHMRHYDVQLIGGMVLHSGAIAEMVTGEGKTLVATLPAYLNAISGRGVHVVTVNDYLARRDMEWMAPLYMGLGLTVGAIQSDMDPGDRQKAYACDITYGTNNEFGFDYLRDNMRPAAKGDDRYPKYYQQSQGTLNFAIIDEVDNILIDEARTPLIISGPAHDNVRKYADADQIARKLHKGDHFEVNEKDHSVNLTDAGVREAERLAGVESFYTAGNMDWPHLIDNSLKAHYLYKLDVNYVVKEGRVVIVDEFTGRLMEGRQWSDGLHQAVEAKEGVKIKEESQTLATITLQNFFKLYNKICGMTGTAMTEANEFWKIYKLDVIAIPTNRNMQRIEFPDVIYCTEEEKYLAIAEEIEQLHKWDTISLKSEDRIGTVVKDDEDKIVFQPRGTNEKEEIPKSSNVTVQRRGRPILVGTTSIEKSERLSQMLERRGIKHEVLNAKHHKREAEIVAQAGRLNAVTIATNMAGRGTDIIMGGNPETMAWAILQDKYATRLDVPRSEWDELVGEIEQREKMREGGQLVKSLGGLHVIGTERHEARRIDLQLRGRCGRQGDPGSSRFYLSLRDDLMRIFAGEWVEKILKNWAGWQEGDKIDHPIVTRRIEAAQKKVEERNFEVRKNLLEYDEVMDEQRKRVYSYRQSILDGVNCKTLIVDMINDQVDETMSKVLDPYYASETFAAWASHQLSTSLEARDFRNTDFPTAERLAHEEAEKAAVTQVLDAVEENLPEDDEPANWNWGALATYLNSRWDLKITDRDLKQIGRQDMTEQLIEKAREAIQRVDLSPGAEYLDEDFSLRTASAWAHHKFGLDLPVDQLREIDRNEVIRRIKSLAIDAYNDREAAYPVMVAMYRFQTPTAGGVPKIDRDGLANWAAQRFQVEVDHDAIRAMTRDDIGALLVSYSRQHQQRANELAAELSQRFEAAFPEGREWPAPNELRRGKELAGLLEWLEDITGRDLEVEHFANSTRSELQLR
ncbi:MAG: preprotein translocase subunit SecA, partial [Planctomycetales bacterium]|nr:preprotein translocase subunit SecA [Planctomycetales bacterium]